MSVLAPLIQEIEAEWAIVETVVEADALVVWAAVKPLLETVVPSQAAILIQAIRDNLATFVIDPAVFLTAVLTSLEAQELAWWKALEPQVQNTLINAFSSILSLGTTPATTTNAG